MPNVIQEFLPEQAFRTVVMATLDKLRAKGHEVPEDIFPELYEAAARGHSVQVDFVCPHCWGDLMIVYDDETISLTGSLFGFATERICH
jgi:hypothetical protein